MEAHPGGFLFLWALKMQFNKPATTFDDQIKLLESRGMVFGNKETAKYYLSHLNYYRIGAYWLHYETDHGSHSFKHGTRFEDVVTLYVFDRELRLLVMDAIERIEVSVRTHLAYELALTYGPHAYLDKTLFKDKNYDDCLEKLEEEINRSKETFIEHYKTTYTSPAQPPIWAVVEVMSFGQLSFWYSNIKNRKDRKKIANYYNIDDKVLASFLHHLSYVRNICAHHGRLWNRKLVIKPNIPKHPSKLTNAINANTVGYLYNTLVMLEYMMNIISPEHHWSLKLKHLINKNRLVNVKHMGFPGDWTDEPIWNNNKQSFIRNMKTRLCQLIDC